MATVWLPCGDNRVCGLWRTSDGWHLVAFLFRQGLTSSLILNFFFNFTNLANLEICSRASLHTLRHQTSTALPRITLSYRFPYLWISASFSAFCISLDDLGIEQLRFRPGSVSDNLPPGSEPTERALSIARRMRRSGLSSLVKAFALLQLFTYASAQEVISTRTLVQPISRIEDGQISAPPTATPTSSEVPGPKVHTVVVGVGGFTIKPQELFNVSKGDTVTLYGPLVFQTE